MKTQKLTVIVMMAGAVAMASPLAAQTIPEIAQTARAAQEAQAVVKAHAADIAQAAQVARTVQDLQGVWTTDVARAMDVARVAAGTWSLATTSREWEQMSDKDRAQQEAQREKERLPPPSVSGDVVRDRIADQQAEHQG